MVSAAPMLSHHASALGPLDHVKRSRLMGIPRTLAPMEALLAAELPEGEGWHYEPKWDGFRCLARREGDEVALTSKSGKPLARFFPDIVEMLGRLKARRFL